MGLDLSTLLRLHEIDPREISRQWIDQQPELRASIEALVQAGALVAVTNASSIVCEFCDEQHWISAEFVEPGHYRGFCPDTGFHSFSPKLLERLVVDDAWVIRRLAEALNLRLRKVPTESSSVFHLGRVRFGPYTCEIFFGRRLADRSRVESASAIIRKKIGAGIGILLTSTRLNLLPDVVCERCAIVAAEDALSISSGRIKVDQDVILAALREPAKLPKGGGIGFRFSTGFRSCVYQGDRLRFTVKQSLAIEALYDAWRDGLPGLHQAELKGLSRTDQRIAQLFSGSPAYGTLIKHDGCGLYWLDL
jgi:hypothetical protein